MHFPKFRYNLMNSKPCLLALKSMVKTSKTSSASTPLPSIAIANDSELINSQYIFQTLAQDLP